MRDSLIARLGPWLARLHYLTEEAHTRYVENQYRRKYDIDPTFEFHGRGWDIYGSGGASLGANSYMGNRTALACVGGKVTIGRDCAISHNVRIYCSTRDADYPLPGGPTITGDVTIGDGVWIGTNVYIGPGVTVGDQAVIGANSVVNHDVPSWTIVGGVPSRVIRRKSHGPSPAN
jgi:maltose O-acetyltransferase